MLSIINSAVREAMIEHGSRYVLEKGGILFREAEPSHGIYLLVSGSVQTRLEPTDKGSAMARVALVGSILGLPATINGTGYSLTAEVLEDGEAIHLTRERLIGLMRSRPEVALALIDVLSKEVQEMRTFVKEERS